METDGYAIIYLNRRADPIRGKAAYEFHQATLDGSNPSGSYSYILSSYSKTKIDLLYGMEGPWAPRVSSIIR